MAIPIKTDCAPDQHTNARNLVARMERADALRTPALLQHLTGGVVSQEICPLLKIQRGCAGVVCRSSQLTRIGCRTCGLGCGSLRFLCFPLRPLFLPSYTSPIASSIRYRHVTLQSLPGWRGPGTTTSPSGMLEYLHAMVSNWRSATLLAQWRILICCATVPLGCRRALDGRAAVAMVGWFDACVTPAISICRRTPC
jgi:hypothetical protein